MLFMDSNKKPGQGPMRLSRGLGVEVVGLELHVRPGEEPLDVLGGWAARGAGGYQDGRKNERDADAAPTLEGPLPKWSHGCMAPEEGALVSAAGKRILIVDDEPGVIEFLEMTLKKEGFQLETASDGQEAVQKIMNARPDLIILDLKLPKIPGIEILRILQANDAGDVPVLIMTGQMSNRETEQMLKLEPNVKGFFTKPFNAGLIAMHVHTLLKTQPTYRSQAPSW